jgi:hypothetical protein
MGVGYMGKEKSHDANLLTRRLASSRSDEDSGRQYDGAAKNDLQGRL